MKNFFMESQFLFNVFCFQSCDSSFNKFISFLKILPSVVFCFVLLRTFFVASHLKTKINTHIYNRAMTYISSFSSNVCNLRFLHVTCAFDKASQVKVAQILSPVMVSAVSWTQWQIWSSPYLLKNRAHLGLVSEKNLLLLWSWNMFTDKKLMWIKGKLLSCC